MFTLTLTCLLALAALAMVRNAPKTAKQRRSDRR
jgi:hypothetical protein